MNRNENSRDIPYLIDKTTVVTIHGDINENSRDKVKRLRNPLHVGKHIVPGRLATASNTFREFFINHISADQLFQLKAGDTINIVETVGVDVHEDASYNVSVHCEFTNDCSDKSIIDVRNHYIKANQNYKCGCAVILHRISIPDEFYKTV